ncbi:MAG: hypothetical protein HY075_14680 [Deltaproteobacteria bacterium]|nr:hypothetical protein [Deltaproteobacteria bacterium]
MLPRRRDGRFAGASPGLESRRERLRFADELWAFVDTSEPDARITGLSPDALPRYEREIQEQLRSNGYSGEMLERVRALLVSARGETTRALALEALGHSRDPKAAGIISDLLARGELRPEEQPLAEALLREREAFPAKR